MTASLVDFAGAFAQERIRAAVSLAAADGSGRDLQRETAVQGVINAFRSATGGASTERASGWAALVLEAVRLLRPARPALVLQIAHGIAWSESGGYQLVGYTDGASGLGYVRRTGDDGLGMTQIRSDRFGRGSIKRCFAAGLTVQESDHVYLADPAFSALVTVAEVMACLDGVKTISDLVSRVGRWWAGGTTPGGLDFGGAQLGGDWPALTTTLYKSGGQVRKIACCLFPGSVDRLAAR